MRRDCARLDLLGSQNFGGMLGCYIRDRYCSRVRRDTRCIVPPRRPLPVSDRFRSPVELDFGDGRYINCVTRQLLATGGIEGRERLHTHSLDKIIDPDHYSLMPRCRRHDAPSSCSHPVRRVRQTAVRHDLGGLICPHPAA